MAAAKVRTFFTARTLLNTPFQRLIAEARSKVPEVTPQQVSETAKTTPDLTIIDVREKEEWLTARAAHPRVVHISKGLIERDVAKVVPNLDSPIVLYCAGGMRSLLAGEALLRMGYKNVKSMVGGMDGWTKAGLPVEQPSKK